MNDPGNTEADRVRTDALENELQEKRLELRELRQSLPAHSARPHQMIEIEDLEEAIAELESRLATQTGPVDQGT